MAHAGPRFWVFIESKFVVASHWIGHVGLTFCKDRKLAIHTFIGDSLLFLDALGESIQEIAVVGQDEDDGLPMLGLIVDGSTCVTLQGHADADPTRLVGNKRIEQSLVDLGGLDDIDSYAAIGKEILGAFGHRRDLKERQARVAHSMPSHMLQYDFTDVLRELGERRYEAVRDITGKIRGEALLEAFQKIRIARTFRVTVRGEP